MIIYTKQSLVEKLQELAEMGWIVNARFGNHGGIGNTLEDYLEIEENNLPIPNAAEWELKTQRLTTSALTTLIHMEPSPRAVNLVPKILLPLYGWAHSKAGGEYPHTEMSFRQTISGLLPTDRGFMVKVDKDQHKVVVSFDATKVAKKHALWLDQIKSKVGLEELNPQPYWGFDDLEHKAGTKLLNCFYVQADVKIENGQEYYWYKKVRMLRKFSFEGFLKAIESGHMYVDFDARSGHNHGTKFRLRQNFLPLLYEEVIDVISV